MITRDDFLKSSPRHNEYYGQFVNSAIVDLVETEIGRDRILASNDPDFNDIPLNLWRRLHRTILARASREIDLIAGGQASLFDTVCIAKAAARLIRKEGEQ